MFTELKTHFWKSSKILRLRRWKTRCFEKQFTDTFQMSPLSERFPLPGCGWLTFPLALLLDKPPCCSKEEPPKQPALGVGVLKGVPRGAFPAVALCSQDPSSGFPWAGTRAPGKKADGTCLSHPVSTAEKRDRGPWGPQLLTEVRSPGCGK